jgi:hypothetical protein
VISKSPSENTKYSFFGGYPLSRNEIIARLLTLFMQSLCRQQLSRGQVIYPATPDSTTVVNETGTSDVLLSLKTELMMVTEVEDEG